MDRAAARCLDSDRLPQRETGRVGEGERQGRKREGEGEIDREGRNVRDR